MRWVRGLSLMHSCEYSYVKRIAEVLEMLQCIAMAEAAGEKWPEYLYSLEDKYGEHLWPTPVRMIGHR